jgi:hypothetical protein
MTGLFMLGLLVSSTVAIAAWLVTANQRSHWAFAAYASWLPLMDLVRLPFTAVREAHQHPMSGIARVAFHVEQSIVVSWSMFFLALCLHYYVRRGSWVPVAVWAAISLGLVIAYPSGARAFGTLYFKTVAYSVTAASWAVIVYGAIFNRAIRVDLAHVLIAMYAAVDVVNIAVPMARADMANWWLVQASASLGGASMIVAQLVYLRKRTIGPTAVRGEA